MLGSNKYSNSSKDKEKETEQIQTDMQTEEATEIYKDSEGNTIISSTGGAGDVIWGDIIGDINNQTDLINLIDSKQDSLTAGNGIIITKSGSTSIISLDSLVLDCGTSTINV